MLRRAKRLGGCKCFLATGAHALRHIVWLATICSRNVGICVFWTNPFGTPRRQNPPTKTRQLPMNRASASERYFKSRCTSCWRSQLPLAMFTGMLAAKTPGWLAAHCVACDQRHLTPVATVQHSWWCLFSNSASVASVLDIKSHGRCDPKDTFHGWSSGSLSAAFNQKALFNFLIWFKGR